MAAAAAFLSAALLFWLEFMAAKALLPAFGGGAGVWAAAVACFQFTLLVGYVLAWRLSAHQLGGGANPVWVWAALLLVAGLAFPFHPAPLTDFTPGSAPGLSALGALLSTAGPAAVVLSGASVALQAGLARYHHDPSPLFAASNLGSFAGLAAYPLLLEPLFGLDAQAAAWAGCVVGAAALTAMAGWLCRGRPCISPGFANTSVNDSVEEDASPRSQNVVDERTRRLLWTLLAAAGAAVFMATSTLLGLRLPAAPLLWAPPLGVYLLSLSAAFAPRVVSVSGFAGRGLLDRFPLLAAAGGATWVFASDLAAWSGMGFVAVLLALEFLFCLLCHGLMHSLRPQDAGDGAGLAGFYFWVALGGLLGGLAGGWAAPLLFEGPYEYLLALVLAAFSVALVQGTASHPGRPGRAGWPLFTAVAVGGLLCFMDVAGGLLAALFMAVAGFWALRGLRIGYLEMAIFTGVCMYSCGLTNRSRLDASIVHEHRTWYAAHTVADRDDRRYLLHGPTIHGMEQLTPGRGGEPMGYYHRSTPAGEFFRAGFAEGKPLAVAGMGAGALSAYAGPGQRTVFYELDPHVVFIAQEYFTFLDQAAGPVEVVTGDCRRSLAEEPQGRFGVLVLDVFAGGAVPVHCLTVEGLEIFLNAVGDDGVVLLQLSNKFLDLSAPVAGAAGPLGAQALFKRQLETVSPLGTPSEWAVLTRNPDMAERLRALGWRHAPEPGVPWTDQRAALWPVLR